MDMLTIVALAAGAMFVLAIAMAMVLGWANQAFAVYVDPRVEALIAALPGANCGGCGCVGCNEYAEAVAAGKLGPDRCPVGGASVAAKAAAIMGVEIEQSRPYRPIVHCRAHTGDRLKRVPYIGEQTCSGANVVAGVQGCTYGCLGLGDCVRACDFDAIHVIDGLATVDYQKCTGCGACARVCPRNALQVRSHAGSCLFEQGRGA